MGSFGTVIFLTLLFFLIVDASLYVCDETTNKFRCATGECISNHSRCDFKRDCEDGSDEVGCNYRECNITTEFKCKNGRCIPQRWMCDDADDCYDMSDEDKQLCMNHTCPENHYQCKGSRACILNGWKCDGDVDCEEEDDEDNCPKVACKDDEFQCSNPGNCIDALYKCDGEDDCRGGEDEVGCPAICKESEFQCKTQSQCIPFTWKCDNTADCWDETDEANCTTKAPKCPKGYFACLRGAIKCIPERWKCDGNAECSDKSDELRCDNIISKCAVAEFQCHNHRQCIPKERRCDGARDCVDSSDEHDCSDVNSDKSKCPVKTHYRCPGEQKVCIPNHKFCDGEAHCPNGEDEKQGPHFCDYNECSALNGNCSHICSDLRVGYECSCPDGYKLGSDRKTCEDVNECESPYPVCPQVCLNLAGSYKCACWQGYSWEAHTKSCKPTNSSNDVALIIADKDRIRKINLHRKALIEPMLNGINVHSIALDISDDRVYWTDPKMETISRARISDPKASSEIILRKPEITDPSCIAVDWIHGHVYWSDHLHETLSVANLDGSFPRTLLQNKVITSVAVHPLKGYLFISILGVIISIERCGLDGKDCRTWHSHDFMPLDIAIDYDHNLVYWVDHMLQTIQAADIEGQNSRVLRYMEDFQPFSLAVYGGRVYWSEAKRKNLYSTNSTGGDLQMISENIYARMDIQVLHPRAQPSGNSLCLNSPCKFLCLPRVNGSNPTYSCECPDRYVVKGDDKTDCKLIMPLDPSHMVPLKMTSTLATTSSKAPPIVTTSRPASSISKLPGMSTGTKALLGIGIIAIIVLSIIIGCFIFRWHKRRTERRSMNFNNPIYRKVTSTPSMTGLDEQSLHSSAGDVNYLGSVNTEPTAGLIMNEERASGSRQAVPQNDRGYTEVRNEYDEIDYPSKNEQRT